MTTEVAVQDQMELIQYKRTLPDEDIRKRIIIFQLADDWATDISSGEYAKIMHRSYVHN